MRAAVFDGRDRPLRIADLSMPDPAGDEVLLRIAACGICGSDLHMVRDPDSFEISEGFVLGHEFAGEVISCGNRIEWLHPGDRVAVAPMRGCGRCETCVRGEPAWCAEMRIIGGGYAEFATVTARQCRVLPSDLPTEEGALAEPLAVALHAVMRSGFKPGNRVLVIGAGPIGLLTAFWARRLGARDVVVSDVNLHQEQRAAAIGATGFALSGPELAATFTKISGGEPDIVFECVGKRGLIDTCCRLVRSHGTVVGVGLCVGGDEWDSFAALSKEVNLRFAAFFSMAEFTMALDAMGPGTYRPQAIVTGQTGFSDLPDTFEALHRKTTQCKVLIRPAASR